MGDEVVQHVLHPAATAEVEYRPLTDYDQLFGLTDSQREEWV